MSSCWFSPATRFFVATAAEEGKQALCTPWVLLEGKPCNCYSCRICKVGPPGTTLRRPLLASAVSHTLGVRRRNIDQVPPLPRSHAPQRARPRIPVPSPTTRSCGGARAHLIPCLPARRRGSVVRSLCGVWWDLLLWGLPLLALRSGRSGGAMPASRFPASRAPSDHSPAARLWP